jgi:UMF1 family MFS transporter
MAAAPATNQPNANRREQIGWYFYDWANSAFSTTVVSVFLGPYLTGVAEDGAVNGMANLLGFQVTVDSYFPFLVSLSVFLQVLFLPILGAIADYTHLKKRLLGLFAYIGAIATMGLYFVTDGNYGLGGLLFVIANLSFGASIVFYNAFLAEIAPADRRDAISSQGWALGYAGGGLLLLVNLLFFNSAEQFGLTSGQAARISMTSAGMWWAIFTIIPLLALQTRTPARTLPPGKRYLTIGFEQLRETFSKARAYPQTLLFLGAYLLYNDGIQTVIALASQFGSEELRLEQSTLIQAILMVQFVAFFGALIFGWIASKIGAKLAILGSLVLWTLVVCSAYAFIQPEQPGQFYILAAMIALVLGGSQALSRSVFSLMIPKGQEAEYFSLYEISERGTSWVGPFFFGVALQQTGSYRIALLFLIFFFVTGGFLLSRVDIRRATLEAGNQAPEQV